MSVTQDSPNVKDAVAQHIYFASIYFVIVGVLYLWGYWLRFGINVLDYLALTDIIKTTAYPIALAVFLVILSAAITEKIRPTGPSGPRQDPKWVEYLLLFIFFSSAFAVLIFRIPERWAILSFHGALACYYQLHRARILNRTIRNYRIRNTFILVAALLPCAAFLLGRVQSWTIQEGHRYMYVVSGIDGYSVDAPANLKPRLIGNAGEFIFLYDPKTRTSLLLKLGDDKPIVFAQYDANDKTSVAP